MPETVGPRVSVLGNAWTGWNRHLLYFSEASCSHLEMLTPSHRTNALNVPASTLRWITRLPNFVFARRLHES